LKRLALFDLDGTLTRADTFLEFIRYVHGPARFYAGMMSLSPFLVLYKLGLYPNWQAKQLTIKHFFGGMTHEEFSSFGRRFVEEKFTGLLRANALDQFNNHLQNGDHVIIVSASCEEWVQPWAEQHNVEALCTRLKIEDNRVTGLIQGHNNYGPEKLRRIRQEVHLDDYEEIYAYGDSRGDREMLSIATHPFYKYF